MCAMGWYTCRRLLIPGLELNYGWTLSCAMQWLSSSHEHCCCHVAMHDWG